MSLQTPKTKSSIGEKFANALNEDLKIINRIRERSLSSGSNEKLLVKLSKELGSVDNLIKKGNESAAKPQKSSPIRVESPLRSATQDSSKKIINTHTVHVNKWALQDSKTNSEKKKIEDMAIMAQNNTSNWDRKASFKQKLISDSLNRLKPTSAEPNSSDDINKVIERTRVSATDVYSTKEDTKITVVDESFQSIKLKDASIDRSQEDYLARTEERIQQYRFHLQSPQTNNSRSDSKSPSRGSVSPNKSLNKSPAAWKKSQMEIQEAIERASSLPKRLETSYSNESDISTRPESRNQSFVAKPKGHERNTSIQIDVAKKFHTNNTEIKEEVIEETERIQPNNQRSSLRTPDFNQQQSSKRAVEAAASAKTKFPGQSKTPTHRASNSIRDTGSVKRTPVVVQPKSATSSKSQLKSLTQSQNSSKKSLSTSASKKDIKSIVGLKPVSKAVENEILKKIKPVPASIESSYASYKKLNQSLNLSRKDLITETNDKHDLSFDEKKNLTFDHSPIKPDLSMSLLGNDLSKDEIIIKAEILKNPELTTEYELFVKLEEIIQKISIKHFIHLRNILKPHSSILLLCQSLIKLLAGLDEFLPPDYTEKKLGWNEIRILFNIPSRFLNLISFYKELVVKGDIPIQNLDAAEETLSSIKNPPPKSDAYTILFEFMCFAIQFYRHFLKLYDEGDTVQSFPIDQEKEEKTRELKIVQSSVPEKPVESSHPNPFSSVKKRKPVGNINSSLASAAASSNKKSSAKESTEKKAAPKELEDVNRNNDNMINLFEKDLEHGNKSLNSITEKKNELLKKLESYAISNRAQSKPSAPSVTPGKNLNKSLDNKENNSGKMNRVKSKSVIPAEYVNKSVNLPSETPEKVHVGHSTRYGDGRLYTTMKDVIVYDKIDNNEREARDYRHRVKKLLADHEKFVKNQILAEEKAAFNFDRQELLAERKRLLDYMDVQQNKEDNFIKQMKHETFITKKEAKERSIIEEKTEEYDKLLRSYDIHLMKESILQEQKTKRMKELHDSQQNMAIKKLLKRKKEAEEQAQLFDELAERSKKRLESKLQAAENDKKKWQKDYILLSNLIMDAK